MRALLIALAVVLSSCAAPGPDLPDEGPPPPPPVPQACVDRLAALHTALDGFDAHGPFAAAVDDEQCGALVVTSDGVAPAALHRVGSVTKTYVAATAVSLARDGLLDLDALVSDLLPDVNVPAGVTVRNLLQHTSGIHEYLDDSALFNEALNDPTKAWALSDLVTAGLAFGPDFAPGAQWSYSNTNYLTMGLVIEAVTGEPWPTVVRDRALDKAQLAHTFVDGADAYTDEIARGTTNGTDTTFALHPSFPASAGNMLATPADEAHWIRLLHATDAVLDDTGRALLTSDLQDMGGGGYGLGTMVLTKAGAGVDAIGHDGSIPGYVTFSFYLPDVDAGVMTVVDDQRGDPNALFIQVLTALGLT